MKLPAHFEDCEYEHPFGKIDFKAGIKDAFHKSLAMALKVLKILVPVVFLMHILVNSEIMDYINGSLSPVAAVFPLLHEALSIAIAD
jgi:hypothetical protein